jgi:hypothetical protein
MSLKPFTPSTRISIRPNLLKPTNPINQSTIQIKVLKILEMVLEKRAQVLEELSLVLSVVSLFLVLLDPACGRESKAPMKVAREKDSSEMPSYDDYPLNQIC